MRSALRDAEATPPTGGWERLERELAAAPKPRVIPLRRSWLRFAAAAAVLILAATGGFLWLPDRGLVEKSEMLLAETAPVETPVADETPQIAQSAAQSDGVLAAAPAARHAAGRKVSNATVLRPQAFAAAGKTPASTAEESFPETTSVSQSDSRTATDPQPQEQERSQPAPRAATPRTALRSGTFVAHTPARKRASLGLFAGGGVTGDGTGTGGQTRSFAMNVPTSDGNVNLLVPRYDYRESSFRHHQPLSFGLSVRKEFAHGLSLESGLVYTLLRSDVKRHPGADDMSQRLHFLGVPLRLNWQFFERGRFSLYIGAGGMVEKCVSAKLGSEKTDEPGVQWSVSAAAGAQYRLGGMVGLYFEPEGSYYLNQTYLRTARTESPLTLTLRLGVRLTF